MKDFIALIKALKELRRALAAGEISQSTFDIVYGPLLHQRDTLGKSLALRMEAQTAGEEAMR